MIFQSVARLRTGVSLEQGRARVRAIAARVAREHPESRAGWSSNLIELRDDIVEPEVRLGLLVLLGGVGLVLLIACVNLANLLLAKGADRAREVALRAALGASRGRIVRQLMTESLLLATAGGAAGLALAFWLVRALIAAAPASLPFADAIQIDAPSIVAAVLLTALTALLFGLVPALSASGDHSAQALRSEGHGAGTSIRSGRLRDVLVIAETALAVLLLAGAGLMLRSVSRLVHVDPGVDVNRVISGRVALRGPRYAAPRSRPFLHPADRRICAPCREWNVQPPHRMCRPVPAGSASAGCSCVTVSRSRPGRATSRPAGMSSRRSSSRPSACASCAAAGFSDERSRGIRAGHDHQRDHGEEGVRRRRSDRPAHAVVARREHPSPNRRSRR